MKDEFPECPICGAAAGYEKSGVFSKYAQCRACQAKWQLFEKNRALSELKLHELPKNGRGVETISGTKAPLFDILGLRRPIDFWKNLKLDASLNWDFLSANVDPALSKAVIIPEEEKILHSWKGTREKRETLALGGTPTAVTVKESGALLLSTHRLFWLKKHESGFWEKVTSFTVAHEIPLEEIRGISGKTGDSSIWYRGDGDEYQSIFLREISVVDDEGESKFHLRNAFLEMFKPLVESAIKMRREEINAERRKERLHIILDFSFLKNYMKKGGLVMKVLKCPECGAKIDFPKSGTETECTYCGSTILAQDVFEKVKRLLE